MLHTDRPERTTPGAVLHAGDWIRLGLDGPLVRFLGQGGGLMRSTTA